MSVINNRLDPAGDRLRVSHVTEMQNAIDGMRPQWGINQTTQGISVPRQRILPQRIDPYHFQTKQEAADSVKVRCGIWTICVGPEEYDVGLTCDDAAAHLDGEYYKTVGSIAASGYITGTLTGGANPGSTQPTTLTASWSATYPSKNTTSPIAVFAKVTVTSGVITAVEQLWNGGDITDKPTVLDNLSLNYITAAGTTKNQAQVYGWDTAAGIAMQSDSILFGQLDPAANRAAAYFTLTQLTTALTGADGPWYGSGAAWNVQDAVEHAHLDFTDVTAGLGGANRQHSSKHPDIGHTYTGDATTHYGAVAFQSIGTSAYALAIDVDNRTLAGVGWDVSDTTAATNTTTGSMIFGGGIGVAGAVWASGYYIDADNQWNPAGNFDVKVNTAIHIEGAGGTATMITILPLKMELVHATELDLTCDAIYYGASSPLIGRDVSNWFKAGGFVGTSHQEISGVYLYNNQGVPLAGPVSVLVRS